MSTHRLRETSVAGFNRENRRKLRDKYQTAPGRFRPPHRRVPPDHVVTFSIYSRTSLTNHLHRSTTPLYRSLYLGPNRSIVGISLIRPSPEMDYLRLVPWSVDLEIFDCIYIYPYMYVWCGEWVGARVWAVCVTL